MVDSAVMVFTFKTVDMVLASGGSESWKLKVSNAMKCRYLVCTRNSHDPRATASDIPHHAAFLVGRISDVQPAREGRYIVLIDQYAEVLVPDVWQSGHRNPVRYVTLDEIGIDPAKLDWKPMPPRSTSLTPVAHEPEDSDDEVRPLTMAEAKQGLALTFGVPPEAIEITIRG